VVSILDVQEVLSINQFKQSMESMAGKETSLNYQEKSREMA
jgi:hypothetical protein